MLKNVIGLVLIFSFCTLQVFAQQSDKDSVEDVVEQLFEAMKHSDGESIRELVTDQATLQTVRGDGSIAELMATDMNQFIESVTNAESGLLNEQIISMTIHIDGDLATAWMDYRFYVKDEFSHCGVNSMNFIRLESNWKIFSIVDTRRKENCY